MMTLFTAVALSLLGSAFADEPTAPELVASHPVQLDTPAARHFGAARPDARTGTLVVLSLDAERMRPRATPTPTLFVDGEPLEVLHQSLDGQCVVGWTTGTTLASAYGPSGLAERLTEADIAEIGATLKGQAPTAEARKRADAAGREALGAAPVRGDAVALDTAQIRLQALCR